MAKHQTRLLALFCSTGATLLATGCIHDANLVHQAHADHGCPRDRIMITQRTGTPVNPQVWADVCGDRRLYRDIDDTGRVMWVDVTNGVPASRPTAVWAQPPPQQHWQVQHQQMLDRQRRQRQQQSWEQQRRRSRDRRAQYRRQQQQYHQQQQERFRQQQQQRHRQQQQQRRRQAEQRRQQQQRQRMNRSRSYGTRGYGTRSYSSPYSRY